MNLKKFFILGLFFWECLPVLCSGDTLRCRFYFPVGSSSLELSYRNNGLCLDSLFLSIHSRQEHFIPSRMIVRAGCSPEGSSVLNRRLSDERLASLRSIIQERISIPDSVFVSYSLGEDWDGLSSLVEESDMPYREETLRILRDTPIWVTRGGVVVDSRKRQLMNLRGGRVWHYMAEHFFPELRSCFVVECEFEPAVADRDEIPVIAQKEMASQDTVILRDTVEGEIMTRDMVQITPANNIPKPFYMGIKTNLLYDAFLVLNTGVELYLGRGWSVNGNWMYAWWKNDKRHRYWRAYGGESGLRKYFGSHAADKPLTGHHIGLYGQMFTYDFEFGGKGYMGGKPGGSLWEKSNYGVGLEYGYSHAIARRLNLDFSLGLGYLGGTYYEYAPMDEHYMWEKTKTRHWFGPTKAEISLVWLLGRGNYNEKKGGKQ